MSIAEFLELGRINSKSIRYQTKKQKAIDISADMLLSHKNPYLALSGGKDSVAMAFIVEEAAKRTNKNYRIWSHVSDASFPGTIDIVKFISSKIARHLDLYEHPFSAFEQKSTSKQAFGKSGVFFDSIRNYAKDKDLSFVGVRAYESKRRMKAAKVHGNVFYSASMGNVTVCYPLLWFRLLDIASVLYEYQAPLHPIYSKISFSTGVNKFNEKEWIRLGYVTSKDLLHKGTAAFIKRNYPEIFNKLTAAFPEVKGYV